MARVRVGKAEFRGAFHVSDQLLFLPISFCSLHLIIASYRLATIDFINHDVDLFCFTWSHQIRTLLHVGLKLIALLAIKVIDQGLQYLLLTLQILLLAEQNLLVRAKPLFGSETLASQVYQIAE